MSEKSTKERLKDLLGENDRLVLAATRSSPLLKIIYALADIVDEQQKTIQALETRLVKIDRSRIERLIGPME